MSSSILVFSHCFAESCKICILSIDTSLVYLFMYLITKQNSQFWVGAKKRHKDNKRICRANQHARMLMAVPPCSILTSDPQGDQAPPVEPSVHLHHPGGLYGDCSRGRLCSLSGEIPWAAVQPHHLLSKPAVRSVPSKHAQAPTSAHTRRQIFVYQYNKQALANCIFKAWQPFHARVWGSSWAVCWWRSWTCLRWEPSAWPCWSTWSPLPATSPSCSWAVTLVPLQEWRSITATGKSINTV